MTLWPTWCMMGNPLRAPTEYMFFTMWVKKEYFWHCLILGAITANKSNESIMFFIDHVSVALLSINASLCLGNRKVVWDAGPAGDWYSPPNDHTVWGLHPGKSSRSFHWRLFLTKAWLWDLVQQLLELTDLLILWKCLLLQIITLAFVYMYMGAP